MCAQRRQISLDIRPVWSESSLSAWRNLGSLATHWVHSEDWSDWADVLDDLSLRWAHMPLSWFCHEAAQFLILILIANCSRSPFKKNMYYPTVYFSSIAKNSNARNSWRTWRISITLGKRSLLCHVFITGIEPGQQRWRTRRLPKLFGCRGDQ